MQNCTFKPQTNNVFNQALAKSSAIMQMRRPGSAHPVAQSKPQPGAGHDSRSVLSGRRDQPQTNGATVTRRAYKPPPSQSSQGITSYGTNLMSRLLDQGEKRQQRLNKDLPMYQSMHQRPASTQIPSQHHSVQNNGSTTQSQMQTIVDDGTSKDATDKINPSHYRVRSSVSNPSASATSGQPIQPAAHGHNLSIQNGIQQLKGASSLADGNASRDGRAVASTTGHDQVAAVMEARTHS